jgi:hypothetical protein
MEIHLYGKLRRFARNRVVSQNSVVELPVEDGDTIESVLSRIGIDLKETSNLFLNGEASSLSRRVRDSDRLGVFPDDMALLYKQYFKKRE